MKFDGLILLHLSLFVMINVTISLNFCYYIWGLIGCDLLNKQLWSISSSPTPKPKVLAPSTGRRTFKDWDKPRILRFKPSTISSTTQSPNTETKKASVMLDLFRICSCRYWKGRKGRISGGEVGEGVYISGVLPNVLHFRQRSRQ